MCPENVGKLLGCWRWNRVRVRGTRVLCAYGHVHRAVCILQCKQETDLDRSEILIELQPLCDEWRPRCIATVALRPAFAAAAAAASTNYKISIRVCIAIG